MQTGLTSLIHLSLNVDFISIGIFIPIAIIAILLTVNATKEKQASSYRSLIELAIFSLMLFSSNPFTLAVAFIFLNLYRAQYLLAMRLAEICMLAAVMSNKMQSGVLFDQCLFFLPCGILLGSVQWQHIIPDFKNIHKSYNLFHFTLIPLLCSIVIITKTHFVPASVISVIATIAMGFFIPTLSEHALNKINTLKDVPEDAFLLKLQSLTGKWLNSVSIFLNKGVSVTLHENMFYILLGIVVLMTLVFNSILSVSF